MATQTCISQFHNQLPFKTTMWQNCNITNCDSPFNTTLTKITTSNSIDTMFTVNSCWSNQDQLDLALVVQKNTKGYTQMDFTSFHLTTSLLSTPKCERQYPKWIDHTLLMTDTLTHTHTQRQQTCGQSLMTIFSDGHRFSRTLGDIWWPSLKTAITSAELWAMFDDNLLRQPSLR